MMPGGAFSPLFLSILPTGITPLAKVREASYAGDASLGKNVQKFFPRVRIYIEVIFTRSYELTRDNLTTEYSRRTHNITISDAVDCTDAGDDRIMACNFSE